MEESGKVLLAGQQEKKVIYQLFFPVDPELRPSMTDHQLDEALKHVHLSVADIISGLSIRKVGVYVDPRLYPRDLAERVCATILKSLLEFNTLSELFIFVGRHDFNRVINLVTDVRWMFDSRDIAIIH